MSDSPPNAEKVNQAIAWYRREKSTIALHTSCCIEDSPRPNCFGLGIAL